MIRKHGETIRAIVAALILLGIAVAAWFVSTLVGGR